MRIVAHFVLYMTYAGYGSRVQMDSRQFQKNWRDWPRDALKKHNIPSSNHALVKLLLSLGKWEAGWQAPLHPPNSGIQDPAAKHAGPRPAAVMDPVEVAFETVVKHCETRAQASPDEPLSPEVPKLLRSIFDADFERLLSSSKNVQNVTCMRPADDEALGAYTPDLRKLPLRPGRVCEGGECCDACSRVMLPEFCSRAECDALLDELQDIMQTDDEDLPSQLLDLESCFECFTLRKTLILLRLLERMRRAVAHEYGLRLSSIVPCMAYVAKVSGTEDQQFQVISHTDEEEWPELLGLSEEDMQDPEQIHELEHMKGLKEWLGMQKSEPPPPSPPHSDEAADSMYHYSALIYLTTQYEHFLGGSLAFSDPPEDPESGDGHVKHKVSPQSGLGILFTSGWENLHGVEVVIDGSRFAIPMFFKTSPSAVALTDELSDDEVIAETLWRLALKPETEGVLEEFTAKWHSLLAGTGEQTQH